MHLRGPVFDALAAGDLESASAASPVPITAYAAGPARPGAGSGASAASRSAGSLPSARAADEPAVKRVRVTIHPDNSTSLALTAQYGFTRVGEHRDETDGLLGVYARGSSPR